MDDQGELFIVSTPIGNLSDITLRALDVLRHVDCIICEDTRVTLKLLNRYEIKKQLLAFHSKSKKVVFNKIEGLLLGGKNAALVTDSGTPVISDPGAVLVRNMIERGITVVPIPGPSSVHTALAASGIPIDRYTFAGFMSNKSARRKKQLKELSDSPTIFVFFESPHRVVSFLNDAAGVFGDVPVCVAKEMTKKYEMYYRGSFSEILKKMEEKAVKGEYTIVIDNRKKTGYK
jgi:16S rRNA (cytidine1402-2'-O)-methyltransferase